MKKVIALIIFLVLFSLLGFIALKLINANLPAIQFFLNPTHKLSSTEQLMLKRARRNPSAIEFKALYQSVVKIAYPTPYIEIGRCAPYPLVARIPLDSYMTFTNSDTKSHTLTFKGDEEITLQPKESKSVLINFHRLIPAPYGYKCDNSPYPVGILFIVQK